MASVARSRWILAIVLIAGIFVAWLVRRRPVQYSVAYVGERSVALWSSMAQVRQTVATLPYGQQVLAMRQAGDQTEIRTAAGQHGWVDTRLLISSGMWRKLSDLVAAAQSMPVQAVGHTRALSNVHEQPSRDAQRIFQFGANVPVVVLDRQSVPIGGAAVDNQAQASPQAQAPRVNVATPQRRPPKAHAATPQPAAPQEDWLLVLRAQAPAAGAAPAPAVAGADPPIAGWILARFVELDPPPPIPDYASAAALHVVAWVVLNSVPDPSGAKPQYVVAGEHGGETPGCEFNAFRVFTWDARRDRYETAYVASDVCGHLPIVVQQTSAGPEFHFGDPGEPGNQRLYEMRQTVVRPVKQDVVKEAGKRPAARRKKL